MKKKKLTHIGDKGEVHMVDTSGKLDSDRYAVAAARVRVSRELYQQLLENNLAKGDALSAARLAGIQAAKRTSEIIPLCHTLPLSSVTVDIKLVEDPPAVEIVASARTRYNTGVEMEALMAASTAALTIYDMGKAIDRGTVIESVRLMEKSGGQSGHWRRKDTD
ncbi:MAG: cyclic pyranopterin monophosphate synthase MoaC [Candidatus Zixiibacteriota bacterium]|nr:MAG: cyclic pyranopterin monophosphate synthase MoaC [candidate division Zixibacteria bacterium]